jgi:hypothetical protein
MSLGYAVHNRKFNLIRTWTYRPNDWYSNIDYSSYLTYSCQQLISEMHHDIHGHWVLIRQESAHVKQENILLLLKYLKTNTKIHLHCHNTRDTVM